MTKLFKHKIGIPESKEAWFRNLCHGKEKVARLRFYIQDALGGLNSTVWDVASSNITSISPSSFGRVRVIDDVITTGPHRNSMKLGRAQGLITFADLQEPALAMNINFYFNAGEYSGSSLCILGRNPILNENRELPVVGGTGAFRMSRGYSISNTYSHDPVANYDILEYIVYVTYVE
ncbi:hypothetical protein DH2020_026844 [Rehmannia glutinosa]|uniref:Dirigent protein n=1 Tax=Rehmannia glutinosa TaxID=99300 RepID=A0ABR0VYQ3_REHGL